MFGDRRMNSFYRKASCIMCGNALDVCVDCIFAALLGSYMRPGIHGSGNRDVFFHVYQYCTKAVPNCLGRSAKQTRFHRTGPVPANDSHQGRSQAAACRQSGRGGNQATRVHSEPQMAMLTLASDLIKAAFYVDGHLERGLSYVLNHIYHTEPNKFSCGIGYVDQRCSLRSSHTDGQRLRAAEAGPPNAEVQVSTRSENKGTPCGNSRVQNQVPPLVKIRDRQEMLQDRSRPFPFPKRFRDRSRTQ